MSDCETCEHMAYHGFRRDGWPSTIYGVCLKFGHNRPPDCSQFAEGEPHYFDKRGVEMTREELDAIPDRMVVDA